MMKKQILIDAMLLRDEWLHGTNNEPCYSPNDVLDSIYVQPIIDPESLPIVQELREENERLKQELSKREIVHAHWERVIEERGFVRTVCSHCKTEQADSYGEHANKYCDECGAMMDGEE